MEDEEFESVPVLSHAPPLLGWTAIERWSGWKGIWSPWTVRKHRKDLTKYQAVIGPIPIGRPCARQKHVYITWPLLLFCFIRDVYPHLNRRKSEE